MPVRQPPLPPFSAPYTPDDRIIAAAEKRLHDGTDAIVVHPTGNLALAWDHRAVDGAYASAFLARVKDILETRDWASEL